MAKNPPHKAKSKIEPWAKDVWLLAENGYSQREILRFLHENQVEISLTALSAWISRRRNKPVKSTQSEPTPEQTPPPRRTKNDDTFQPSGKLTASDIEKYRRST
jgi:hypothetical protein